MKLWIAAIALLLPAVAGAQTVTYCVGDTAYLAPLTNPCSFDNACDFYSTVGIQDALSDTATTNPNDYNVDVCVWDAGIHVESVDLDNDVLNIGTRLEIRFRSASPATGTWCPESISSAPDGMNLRNLYDENDAEVGFFFRNVYLPDDPACDDRAGIAEVVNARAGFDHGAAHVGTSQGGGRNGAITTAGQGSVHFGTMYFHGGDRGIVHGPMGVVFADSAVVGVLADSGSPLINLTAPNLLSIGTTAFVANGTVGQPLIRSRGVAILSQAKFLGNAVTGGQPLLELETTTSLDGNWMLHLIQMEVARNTTWVETVTPTMPSSLPAPVDTTSGSLSCLPVPLYGTDTELLTATASATLGGGPLFLFDSNQSIVSNGVMVNKSLIVENSVSSNGIFQVEGLLGRTDVLLLNNTIEVDAGVPVLRSTAPSGSFASARNLYLGQPSVSLNQPWDIIEASMDLISGSDADWISSFNANSVIGAPVLSDAIPAPQVVFQPTSAFDALATDCDRSAALCGDVDVVACQSSSSGWCPADRGRAYLPDAATVEVWGDAEWPWAEWTPPGPISSGPLVERRVDDDIYNMAGATGLACSTFASNFDDFESAAPPLSNGGDGDGFSALIDCNNEDGGVVPGIPTEDGYTVAGCNGATCYTCPSVVPEWLGDDDDSAGDDDDSAGDDDDSAGDDDDDSAPTDNDGDGFVAGVDCNDNDALNYPGAPELCNGQIDDCDSAVLPLDEQDPDGDFYLECWPYEGGNPAYFGGDCDPTDFTFHPLAPELCDGLDNDCSGTLPSDEQDSDGDDVLLCAPYVGENSDLSGGDCNDADPLAGVPSAEVCNGLDDDCDGNVFDDEIDDDGDGYVECSPWTGDPSLSSGDCNDSNSAAYEGATEICDGVDDDCDGNLTLDEQDFDGDQYVPCADWSGVVGLASGDCDDADPSVSPSSVELCDGVDNDCSGDLPADEADDDIDGVRICDDDCDDGEPTVYPGAPELCDGLDNACIGSVPEDETDDDGDGYVECGPWVSPDTSPSPGDCNDSDPLSYPGAPELCNGQMDDCDGSSLPLDEQDTDGDFHVACDGWEGADTAISSGDCDEGDASINASAVEACDGVDEDCDGVVPDDELDSDGDGFVSCDNWVGDPGLASGDCDDGDVGVHEGADEGCNGVDNDCDGSPAADEADLDGDGYLPCDDFVDEGLGLSDGDCDDSDAAAHPDQAELCDGIEDTDCDPKNNEPEGDIDGDSALDCEDPDADGDGVDGGDGSPDCDDLDPTVGPGFEELCDGILNDCAGELVGEEDSDGDQVRVCEGDCDDADPFRFPGADEECNGIDDDCDPDTLFSNDLGDDADLDGDGYLACADDCADDPADDRPAVTAELREAVVAAERNPGATEVCNGVDDDCDGLLFEDAMGSHANGVRICPAGAGDHVDPPRACQSVGCGTSYGLGMFLPLFGLVLRRRRVSSDVPR